jgi:ATP-binding cassette, subfamily B, bacterial PglK
VIKPFLRSLRLLRPRQRLIFIALTSARVVTNLLDVLGLMAIGLLGAMLASGLNDRTEASFAGFSIPIESSRDYLWITVLIAVFFLSKSLLATILLRLSSLFLARAEGKAAVEIAEFIYSGDLSRVKQFSRGDLQFVLTSSSQQSMTGLLMSGAAILTEGALFISVVIVFVFVDPSTAAVITVYFLLLVMSFQLLINRRLKRLGQRLSESAIGVTNTIQDLTLAFREIVVFSRRWFFLDRFGAFRKRYAQDVALEAFLMGLPRFFVETGLMIGVLAIIGFQFLRGNLSDGLVTTAIFLAGGVRMMAALLPLQNAVANIKMMGPQADMAQGLIEKARSGFQAVDAEPEDRSSEFHGEESHDPVGYSVKVQDVTFTHVGSEEPAINGVSLDIAAGGYVAFVGPSGAGKTTLADLILGINTPESGQILVGELEPAELRKVRPGAISYVPQNPGMVSGTIAENVALGEPTEDIDRDRVWDALEKAELADFVRTLPNGIDSDLGKQSDSLSGGQKQRLGLARALYPNPRLLVLDEATSALDAGTEASISATIEKLEATVTVIVIAHRLSTIQHADVVYVVEEGKISAEGTFSEVRKKVSLIEEYVHLMKID